MKERELNAILDGLAPVLAQTIKEMESRLNAAIASIKAPEVDLDEIAQRAAALIPAPKDGESVTLEQVEPILSKKIDAWLDDVPIPENGTSVTLEDVEPLLKNLVEQAVAALPPAKKGDKGDDGESVTVEQIAPLVQEEVEKRLAEIKIPKGDKGDKGEVDPDELKELVSQEVERAVSEIEVEVPPGEPGRDALQIEVLPSIDFDKSYPRGTFASHQGSLWRAWQQTEGEKGWEPIVRGYAQPVVEQRDERSFAFITPKPDGTKNEEVFTLPVAIYRGVWRDDQTYQRGDMVTLAGSVWHCNEDDNTKKPGTKDCGWQLAVKAGRDKT